MTRMTRTALLSLSAASAAALASFAPSAALAVPAGGYADLVETVSPSVVYVEVTNSGKGQPSSRGQKDHKHGERNSESHGQRHGQDRGERQDNRFGRHGDQQLQEFMRRFGFPDQDFGQNRGQNRDHIRPMKSAGSGFIIAEDGLIVTNNHVIAGASEVTVTLADGSKHEASIVGADPLTDIALLQVTVEDALPVVAFGTSEELRVGEEVIAMGSPFGLSGTVTSGIVSATSRNINAGPFDDFIQTDAAINRGNSGGPLFNAEGDVVGVNTAIFSSGGGSVGIGFAVPSDLVRDIVTDLQDDGEVDRGWLGVQIKPLSPDAANVLGIEPGKGVMIESVVADSPAAAAGLKAGDVVLSFAGAEVGELRDLTRAVAMEAPEAQSEIEILRRGKSLTLEVTLGNRASQDA